MELLVPSGGLIFVTIVSLVGIIAWAVALFDVVRSRFAGSNDKLTWAIVVLFAPVIGVLLYVFVGRKSKINY